MRLSPTLILLPMLACAPLADDLHPPAGAHADGQAPPPPVIDLVVEDYLLIGHDNALTVEGDLGPGERVYFGASLAGEGPGPCLGVAGGLCLGLLAPVRLLGSAVADGNGVAAFSVHVPAIITDGTDISLQALVVRSIGGVDSIATLPATATALDQLPEGAVLPDWVPFPFTDNGYRNGCVGGAKYVKSTPYTPARYVGITSCGPSQYKIWLSDLLYGTFISAGDWSGAGEDQCEYVGGSFVSFPQGSTSVDPGQPCWSRGPLGATPAFEATCQTNRWIAKVHACDRVIPPPPGPPEGSVLTSWTAFDFYDNGYRDGCSGGAKYIKSTAYPTPGYVGVTLCSASTYKIWLSETIYGPFISAGDWSGAGEDHCEYVGGTFSSFPSGSISVDPGQSCWSRGPAGVAPLLESPCQSNRWVPSDYRCGVSIP